MFCENRPQTYLVWHIEHEFWKPGDMVALCPDHVTAINRRIRSGLVSGCDLLHSTAYFDDGARCYWDEHWPLVSDFAVIKA